MEGVGSLLRLVALIIGEAFQSRKTPDPEVTTYVRLESLTYNALRLWGMLVVGVRQAAQ